ncbi:hypothetical protein BDA99DRAFT_524234 [Phascolomyces articulosus]|uniref:NAB co-repressor domain-containing protein n=1 Tax=Phascolomyces articulosus TaxID=60185 RepID=A0AAD5JQ07_9FUNG|nr:hypothetical protein BDA99DRAFT_524234 [Phascolomyces articulosus]
MQSSLHAFLLNHNLDQYYEAFVKSGATDQDLLQLLHFNDEELNDILHAVNMLPFHAIKFKRALRELKVQTSISIYSTVTRNSAAPSTTTSVVGTAATEATPNSPLPMRPGLDHILNTPDQHNTQLYTPPTYPSADSSYYQQQSSSEQTSREVIISHATIYGKNSSRPLTSYESAINEAAIQLSLENPSLLVNKGNLFELAKKKLLDSGYQYKRGKSRSKLTKGRTNSTTPEQQMEQRNARRSRLHAKRKMNAERMSSERRQRIEELEIQLQSIAEQQRQRPEEFSSLETTRTALNKEISKIKAKERKHQWYERRKMDRSDTGGISEETTTEEEQHNANDDDARSIASLSSAGSSSVTTASSSVSIPSVTTSLINHHHHHVSTIQQSSINTKPMGPMSLSRESDVRAKAFHEPTIARSEIFSSV